MQRIEHLDIGVHALNVAAARPSALTRQDAGNAMFGEYILDRGASEPCHLSASGSQKVQAAQRKTLRLRVAGKNKSERERPFGKTDMGFIERLQGTLLRFATRHAAALRRTPGADASSNGSIRCSAR